MSVDAGRARELARHEEVAVAVHEEDRDAREAAVQVARRCAAGKAQGEAVVADPVLEEVAEDVERVGAGRDLAEEPLETRRRFGPRRVQVQVRDEERAPQTTTRPSRSPRRRSARLVHAALVAGRDLA